jgi:fimbrial chaperone protein
MRIAAGLSRPLCFGLALLLAAIGAHGGSFTANPVRLSIAPGATSTSLLLENKGEEPVLVQAELLAWTQKDGEDVLTPTQNIIVSPPIFKVGVGGAQTVRVGLLAPATGDREVTYRLFLQEVAQPPKPGEQGVGVSLRLGLPIFVMPRGAVTRETSWRVKADGGAIRLTLVNAGNVHVQAIDCKLYREDGTLVAEQQLASYVLARQARSWLIKPAQPWRGEKLKAVMRTPAGDVTGDVIVE